MSRQPRSLSARLSAEIKPPVSHDAAAQEEDADVWDANDGLDAAVMLVAVVVLLVVVVVAWA